MRDAGLTAIAICCGFIVFLFSTVLVSVSFAIVEVDEWGIDKNGIDLTIDDTQGMR